MTCKKCKQRGKNWNGDDPSCFFSEGDHNWNCATINEIRDICYEGQEKMPYGVDYQYCEDMKYATINIDQIEDVDGMALWVAWYKNRGKTDQVLILDSETGARDPTEKECLNIINHFNYIKQ